MKVPRNVSGDRLVRELARRGYVVVRQSGSHVRLTRETKLSEHHVTIPMHNPIKVGTLTGILNSAAGHLGIDAGELAAAL